MKQQTYGLMFVDMIGMIIANGNSEKKGAMILCRLSAKTCRNSAQDRTLWCQRQISFPPFPKHNHQTTSIINSQKHTAKHRFYKDGYHPNCP